jgi:hypothetical protein
MSNTHSYRQTVTNCTFIGNSADENGAGMYNYSCKPTVTNSTFVGNSADQGGGMYNYGGPTVTNCILWGNIASDGNEIYNDQSFGPSDPVISYCDISACLLDGAWDPNLGTDVGGNIDTDPCFASAGYWVDVNDANVIVGPNDPNAIWVDGNYRLLGGSPCIDAGDNDSVGEDIADLDNDGNTVEAVPFDLNGFERFIDDLCTIDTGNGAGPIVDIGAYEFLRSDIDSSGGVDFVDLAAVANRWGEISCGLCGGGDVTCDGDVDMFDVNEVFGYWLE